MATHEEIKAAGGNDVGDLSANKLVDSVTPRVSAEHSWPIAGVAKRSSGRGARDDS